MYDHLGYTSRLRYLAEEAKNKKYPHDHAPTSLAHDSTLKEGHNLFHIVEESCSVVKDKTTDNKATVPGGTMLDNTSEAKDPGPGGVAAPGDPRGKPDVRLD